MLKIRALPALEGDCLWIEYGEPGEPRRVLVDGGPAGAYPRLRGRIEKLPARSRHFELLVVTHIDDDHIGGVLELLGEAPSLGVTFGDVWFNGRSCLGEEVLGPAQGDALSEVLLGGAMPWNMAFRKSDPAKGPPSYREAVVVPEKGALPVVTLAGDGPKLTLLGPTRASLDALLEVWDTEVLGSEVLGGERVSREDPDLSGEPLLGELDVEELAASPPGTDPSRSNASSIVLLLEYGEVAWLLAGDARHGDMTKGVARLLRQREQKRLALDLLKAAHHGSRNNLSASLLELVECKEYLLSTDGGGPRRAHPHRAAIARMVRQGGQGTLLHFNYRTEYNDVWDSPALCEKYGYRTSYPLPGKEGISLVWK